MPGTSDPKIVDISAETVETNPLINDDDIHEKVAERIRHSKEFGSLIWEATKDYLQKMNLTPQERSNVSDWLVSKKDKLQQSVVAKMHDLHQNEQK
ncbi:MAG: hypothetical protein QGG29_04065 [Prochlorococcaceae cyanobacterium ETNP18_MAG_17]|nr:hypothetical protein [Prochlorococcaceae cyanobacterium ETNP18_MAG_17]